MTSRLSDHFSDTWKLLSQTSRFLSRTAVFAHYEDDLRAWRLALQRAANDDVTRKRIHREITELRASLRRQGFDLSLARQNLVLEGFRNDTAAGEGFRRVVIYFFDDYALWLAGEDNHVTLAQMLEKQWSANSRKMTSAFRSKHYLWYRRNGNDLILCGSDSEGKADYERLKAMAGANDLEILAKLKDLR